MAPKVSRRSTKPKDSPRQARRERKECDICARSFFIEGMIMLAFQGITTYCLCLTCGEIATDIMAKGKNCNSKSTRRDSNGEGNRPQEAQREFIEVLERLRAEKRRGKELEKLLKMDTGTKRTCWNTPINEQSLEELIVSNAALEKLRSELDDHLAEMAIAERAASSSDATTSASISAVAGPSCRVGSSGRRSYGRGKR
ncbi:hypothetical protein CDL15_Pgr021247 [Punica granatum]|uniref:Uncharacterized protein n=1 Tax=Punica granatum TaxID=22663 RepID=A0A218WQJ0_PUNGR|nr:hypothetical protein CDL15_Pgr021247 [Punica granatum]PKI68347.1 hypothetical protein CRG98_011255 [Punica granatum]